MYSSCYNGCAGWEREQSHQAAGRDCAVAAQGAIGEQSGAGAGGGEGYSKVGRLYIRTQRDEVVVKLERQGIFNEEEIVSMENKKVFLRNQLRE